MAMCIMDTMDKNDFTKYNIHLWEVFNILGGELHVCKGILKSGKECNKRCGFTYDKNSQKYYCCKTHFPKDIPLTKRNIYKEKKIVDYLLQDITSIVIQKLIGIYEEYRLLFDKVRLIHIELQPKINNKMKLISHLVYGKFVEIFMGTNVPIRFVRAAKKLKAYTGPLVECKLKGSYARRKYLSIKYTEWFLQEKFNNEQRDKWLVHFKSHTKLDDLGDVFLMAIGGTS